MVSAFMSTDLLSRNQLQPLTFLYDLISVLIKIELLFCLIDGGKQEEMFFWGDFFDNTWILFLNYFRQKLYTT